MKIEDSKVVLDLVAGDNIIINSGIISATGGIQIINIGTEELYKISDEYLISKTYPTELVFMSGG